MEKIIYAIQKYDSKKGWNIAWDLDKTFFSHKYEAQAYIDEHKIEKTCVCKYVKE